MLRVSSVHFPGCIRTAFSSLPWQRCILHGSLLQNVSHLNVDQVFLSTSAIRNPLLGSQCKIHQSCSRPEGLSIFRTPFSDTRTISIQQHHLIHTNYMSKYSNVISKQISQNVHQYLFRNCLFSPRESHLLLGSFRFKSSRNWSQHGARREKNKSVMLYVIAGAVLVCGFSYAAVPLYTVFCQATGLGGQATAGHDIEKVETMAPVKGRELVIRFNADTAASMRWNFRPQQSEVKVVPGETALAFYSAMNPTDKPIVGISTYNVVPFDAGQYFNKIQCFCFEEQRLNPHEQVDMPVFFYIDPEFDEDPKMQKVNDITLSYTFFESKEGLELPDPWARPE